MPVKGHWILKSIVLIEADSEAVILLFDRVIAGSLILSALSSLNEKDAIHFPVIIGSSLKEHNSDR